MEQDVKTLIAKIDAQSLELAEIKKKVRRVELYFLWTGIITVAAIVLPLLGLLFAVPKFMSSYTDIQSLGL